MFLPALLQLCCPHMDTLEDIPIIPNLWGPESHRTFRGSNSNAGHSGIISLDTAQDVVCPLSYQDTLMIPMEPLSDFFCRTGFQSLLSQFILCLALLHLRCRICHLDLLNFIPLIVNSILFRSWGENTHPRLYFRSLHLFRFTKRSLGMRHFSRTESQNFGGKQAFPAWIKNSC